MCKRVMIENILNKTVLVDKKALFKYNLLFIIILIISDTVKDYNHYNVEELIIIKKMIHTRII